MVGETSVVPAEPQAVEEVPIYSILAPPGNFQGYMQKLVAQATTRIDEAKQHVVERRSEIAAREPGLQALIQRAEEREGGHEQRFLAQKELRNVRTRLARALKAVKQAESFRDALLSGYVPLPRMPAVSLRYAKELMPHDVLDAMEEAREAQVFEEFRIVTGEDADSRGQPGRRRLATVDPILVGMVGDELFAVAWWR